jgi:dihydroflavonol-4-reductase
VTLKDMLTEIARRTGRRAPRVRLPRAPLYPLALFAEGFARVSRREPLLTRDALAMARSRLFFSSARAEGELGYRARPYGEAIGDALAWFAAEGML